MDKMAVKGEYRRLYAVIVAAVILACFGGIFASMHNTPHMFKTPHYYETPYARPYMPFSEFLETYGNATSFLEPDERLQVESYMANHQSEEKKNVLDCHRVDLEMPDLPTVPVPDGWCNRGYNTKKTYVWVIGDAFSGTTAMLSMLINAQNISALCLFEDGEPYKLCEGLRYIAPPDVMEMRLQDYWPKDFKTEVIEEWEDLWRNPAAAFRVDKSPPWAIKVGQIVDQLMDRDGMRVAFIFLTRSKCSEPHEGPNGFIDRFAMQYEYMLRRNIPVMHVRYEDFPHGVERIKERLNNWCSCIDVPSITGFQAYMESHGEELSDEHADRGRYTAVEDYVEQLTPKAIQQPLEKKMPVRFLPALAYFGYTLTPAKSQSEG